MEKPLVTRIEKASGTVITSNPLSFRKDESRAMPVVFPPHGPPVRTTR